MNLQIKPKDIAIDRTASTLKLTWVDSHISEFNLRWVRANCPCATCREERRASELNTDMLKLSSGPLPSLQISSAELVGNYALRLTWTDGHTAGIYAFSTLRASCPCVDCHPEGPPPLLLAMA